jgi:acyl carrier protein
MGTEEITSAVREVTARILSTELPAETSVPLTDFGLDSLASVELTLDLEDHFQIAFDDDELQFEKFATVDNIVALIAGKVSRED